NSQLQLYAAFSITGPLIAPETCARVWLLDSIIDGVTGASIAGPPDTTGPAVTDGPPLTVERSTLWGAAQIKELEASESIFADLVTTVRVQQGCVRFSY